MKWSINQLQRYRQGDMPIDEVVNLDSVKKRNSEIRAIAPLHITGSCTIRSTGLTCTLQLDGSMTLPCARTWEDVDYLFKAESIEVFSWDEAEIASDDEIHPVVGDFVDVTPVLEELVLLEIPMQVFSEQAKNMKTAEGQGWSYVSSEEYDARIQEEKKKVDPRLADLANFFDKEGET